MLEHNNWPQNILWFSDIRTPQEHNSVNNALSRMEKWNSLILAGPARWGDKHGSTRLKKLGLEKHIYMQLCLMREPLPVFTAGRTCVCISESYEGLDCPFLGKGPADVLLYALVLPVAGGGW